VKRLLLWLTLQLKVAMLKVASGTRQADLVLEEEECVETTLASRSEPQILDRSDHRGGACSAFAARSTLG
jgi:hypothetical protein